MSALGARPGRAGSRWRAAAAGASATLLLASCGLPGGGEVQTIDDDTVPYRLLESGSPTTGSSVEETRLVSVPVVLWVAGDRLIPEAAGSSCEEPPEEVAERLLGALVAGPSDDARAAGRSSAIPPEWGLALLGLVDGTAEVAIQPETSVSADRLPVAVGQVVLTLTSAPSVDSVLLVSDAQPLQVPLPGGVLTDGPVTAADYGDLLPGRLSSAGSFGCPAP